MFPTWVGKVIETNSNVHYFGYTHYPSTPHTARPYWRWGHQTCKNGESVPLLKLLYNLELIKWIYKIVISVCISQQLRTDNKHSILLGIRKTILDSLKLNAKRSPHLYNNYHDMSAVLMYIHYVHCTLSSRCQWPMHGLCVTPSYYSAFEVLPCTDYLYNRNPGIEQQNNAHSAEYSLGRHHTGTRQWCIAILNSNWCCRVLFSGNPYTNATHN